MRPLTSRQTVALKLAAIGHISTHSAASMPGLQKRGLVEKLWTVEGGRRVHHWKITEDGRAYVRQLQEEGDAPLPGTRPQG